MHVSPFLESIEHEEDQPIYLARIWVPPRAPGQGWRTADWLLAETSDVASVLEWISEAAGDHAYQLFVLVEGNSFICLQGQQPEDTIERVEITFSM